MAYGQTEATNPPQQTHHRRLLDLIESIERLAHQFDEIRVRTLGEIRPQQGSKDATVRPIIQGYGQALSALEVAFKSLNETAQALEILA